VIDHELELAPGLLATQVRDERGTLPAGRLDVEQLLLTHQLETLGTVDDREPIGATSTAQNRGVITRLTLFRTALELRQGGGIANLAQAPNMDSLLFAKLLP
jgi:hypothetical protein